MAANYNLARRAEKKAGEMPGIVHLRRRGDGVDVINKWSGVPVGRGASGQIKDLNGASPGGFTTNVYSTISFWMDSTP